MSLLQNEKTDEIRKHNTSQLAQFQVGDLIEFPRGIYSHWAVYIGEGELVHLAGDNSNGINGNVNSTHLFTICGRRFSKAFVCVDSFWNVVGDSKAFRNNSKDKKYRPLSPDEIVGNALMKLGEVGYNVVYENCEHFASWCRYGSSWSEQADRLVFWIKSLTGIASSLAFLFGVARVFRLREKNKDLN